MNDVDFLLLIKAMENHADLTLDGFNGPDRPAYLQRRAELLGAYDEFFLALAWLRAVPKTLAPNVRDGHSYAVKHVVEDWAGRYISNGTVIAAALVLDVPIRRCESGINAWIAIRSRRSWPAVSSVTK